MKVKAIIWDLDGTLLNTLDDLAGSTNAALAMNGMPVRTTDEVRRFVGNGIHKLIERAMPELGAEHPKFQVVLDSFVAHYGEHSKDHTKPYDGIIDVLDKLTARGVKIAIVSNKIDFAVKALSKDYFGDRMLSAVGDDPSRRKKPAPDSVLEAMRQMGVSPDETIYIGDSDVDVITARNAGIPCIAVTWGFRSEESLIEAGAQYVAHQPADIIAIAERI